VISSSQNFLLDYIITLAQPFSGKTASDNELCIMFNELVLHSFIVPHTPFSVGMRREPII
jgi:hypothetical protein